MQTNTTRCQLGILAHTNVKQSTLGKDFVVTNSVFKRKMQIILTEIEQNWIEYNLNRNCNVGSIFLYNPQEQAYAYILKYI